MFGDIQSLKNIKKLLVANRGEIAIRCAFFPFFFFQLIDLSDTYASGRKSTPDADRGGLADNLASRPRC